MKIYALRLKNEPVLFLDIGHLTKYGECWWIPFDDNCITTCEKTAILYMGNDAEIVTFTENE